MILPIYIYGQPCLRKVSEDITLDYPELTQLVDNMWETLASSEGIGLAAPQIGKNIRLVVIDLDLISEDFPEYKDFKKVFINPHILEYDEESPKDNLEEGCLSLPGIHEKVQRPTRIHAKWMELDGTEHDEWIDGKMFIDRITPLRRQLIKNKLKAMTLGKYRCAYRTKPVRR